MNEVMRGSFFSQIQLTGDLCFVSRSVITQIPHLQSLITFCPPACALNAIYSGFQYRKRKRAINERLTSVFLLSPFPFSSSFKVWCSILPLKGSVCASVFILGRVFTTGIVVFWVFNFIDRVWKEVLDLFSFSGDFVFKSR